MIKFFFLLVLFNLQVAAIEAYFFQVPVFTYESLPEYYFKTVSKDDLCQHKRIVIYGIRAYREARNIDCPQQLRLIAGILYVSEVYDPKHVYLSPLPHPKLLSSYGQAFVVFYSSFLEFYVEKLRTDLTIRAIRVNSAYELEREFQKGLGLNFTLLLLPDPLMFDPKSQSILRYWLKNNPKIEVVDLAGLDLPVSNKVVIRIPKEKYWIFLREKYMDHQVKRGHVYFFGE